MLSILCFVCWCTAEELINKETKGTGCSYDILALWSSTPCSDPEGLDTEGFGSYIRVTGRGRRVACETAFWNKNRVRCCADILDASEATPTKAPSLAPESASTCDDLGWTNADKHGDSSVCGDSEIDGSCSGEITWTEADEWCASTGARLCTVDETLNKEAKSTGCRADAAFVWTSTGCSGGYSTTLGNGDGGGGCEAGTGGFKARCCADVGGAQLEPTVSPAPTPASSFSASTCDELGWTNANTYGSTAVCGESEDPAGDCSDAMTWPDAVAWCESFGARICTFDELGNGEPSRTGCRLGNTHVWSSTACDGGYSVLTDNDKSETDCYPETTTTKVRCCADTSTDLTRRRLRGYGAIQDKQKS